MRQLGRALISAIKKPKQDDMNEIGNVVSGAIQQNQPPVAPVAPLTPAPVMEQMKRDYIDPSLFGGRNVNPPRELPPEFRGIRQRGSLPSHNDSEILRYPVDLDLGKGMYERKKRMIGNQSPFQGIRKFLGKA